MNLSDQVIITVLYQSACAHTTQYTHTVPLQAYSALTTLSQLTGLFVAASRARLSL
jgi:hypothetical protein